MQRGFRAIMEVNNKTGVRSTEESHENLSHAVDVLVGNRKWHNKQAVQMVNISRPFAHCVSVNITNKLMF